jgi:hypothetical protein
VGPAGFRIKQSALAGWAKMPAPIAAFFAVDAG